MKLFLILSALTLSLSGHSQLSVPGSPKQDTSASCVAYWKLNETKIYSIVHEKRTTDSAGKHPPFRFAYEAWITVIDSTANNYTIKWVFHLPEGITLFRPKLADSLPVYNGMQMIFRTTETGKFIELLNWEEVRDTYSRMMDLSRPKKMDSATAAILKSAKDMYNSREMVESSMIQEIHIYHVPYGYKFTTTEISAGSAISSPFGGDAFPAIQTYKITDLQPKADSFTLAVNMRIDKANTKSMVDTLFKKMNIKDDSEMQAAREKYFSFDLHDFSKYTFIKSTGWIKRLYYNRTITIAGTTQTEIYTITLKN